MSKEREAMKETVLYKAENTSRSYTDLMVDPLCGFYVPEYFHMALYMERKRRERSQRPMYLMLIDVMQITEDEQATTIKTIADALSVLTRETDIKGWYSDGQAIGVIFTEFNTFDRQEMSNKIKNGLERVLPSDQMNRIGFAMHEFPQKNECEQAPSPVLYPDVTKKYGSRRSPFLIKRIIDVVGSIAGLILFSPFFLVIPALIRLTSSGPILFRQERIGLYGKKFMFLKFRTMYLNNDSRVHEEYVKKLIAGQLGKGNEVNGNGSGQKPVFKIQNDKRITPLGQFLRKTSLDELPQFFNVLFGDMSLVGPRPPIPYEMQNYDIWHRCRVVEVKPGITGLWQVMGRSSTTFDEMVRLDIKYSREWSIWLDLKILLMTPWAVLKGKGAY
jgi:exopolysaccharide biosynthesis polyprenyl glycosylphosphotransferase